MLKVIKQKINLIKDIFKDYCINEYSNIIYLIISFILTILLNQTGIYLLVSAAWALVFVFILQIRPDTYFDWLGVVYNFIGVLLAVIFTYILL